MFGLFGSNTPQYQGAPQSGTQSSGGLMGFFGRLFGGGGAPAYSGAGQPHTSGSGTPLFPTSPAYVQPVAVATSSPDVPVAEPDAVPVSNDNVAPPPVKTVTIIVKPGPGTTVDEVVEFLRDRCSIPSA